MADVSRFRHWLLAAVALAAVIVVALQGPIAQPAEYHRFADQRVLWSVPNALNVLSNLGFVVVGVVGLVVLGGRSVPRGALPPLQQAYRIFFAGAVLIGLGSAYYHLAPDNARLVWDRMPMTVSFMALVAIVVGEQVDEHLGSRLLWPLLAVGVGSVLVWWFGERVGRGDLRMYLLVQFLPMLLLPLMMSLYPTRLHPIGWLWALLGLYACAKAFEFADATILGATSVSGHSLKHLVAAAAMAMLVFALRRRRLLPG